MKLFWTDLELFNQLETSLRKSSRGPVAISGSAGAAGAALVAGLSARQKRPVLIVVKNAVEAVRWTKDLKFFSAEEGMELIDDSSTNNEPGVRSEASGRVILFPEYRQRNEDSDEARATFNAHLSASLHNLSQQDNPIAVAPVSFLAVRMADPKAVSDAAIEIRSGADINVRELMQKLVSFGFERGIRVEKPGEFAYRGGILDVYIPAYSLPVRIEFFGDEIVSIREFDALTQRSISRVKTVRISGAVRSSDETECQPVFSQINDWFGRNVQIIWMEPDALIEKLIESDASLLPSESRDDLPGDSPVFWDIIETTDIESDRRFPLPIAPVPEFKGDYRKMASQFRKWTDQGTRINVVYHRESVRKVVNERLAMADLDMDDPETWKNRRVVVERLAQDAGVNYIAGTLSRGFHIPSAGIVYITERDIVGKKQRQPWQKRDDLQDAVSFQDLRPGDLVVHMDHGIGCYDGLHRLTVNGKPRDFLLLRYANDQKLYLPVDKLHLIQRYMSAGSTQPHLDKMGGVAFKKRQKKIKESVLKLAAELLKLFSRREVVNGFAFPSDDAWQREFELGFAYEETPDQMKAIIDVKGDMENTRPMDRIVCGDVGYGKTEVAIRAAFKAAVAGKQVAVLVPTTILAQQHFRSFQKRMKQFPLKISMLSRFLGARDKKEVLKQLAAGNIDIIVGTHALLADSVRFENLGLVIIDEEQRFGVKHKEKMKQIRTRVDVLTLTATPIPRTLNLALLGLREISLINTPPESRLPIDTRISKFDRKIIREAILREMERGGQVYFVHNRVQSIYAMAEMVRNLVPEARLCVGHGQMSESKLEKIMLNFLDKEFDVLVCTTIIESGLDIPSVNTIIINRADRLGLAQLYQLRGRVGRAQRQAYAHLLVPPTRVVTDKARERLTAIREAVELGAGFKLATRDLDIRGAGDILGANQHGHITAVGFDMYCKMIREAVQELKGVELEDIPECEIKLPCEMAIPEAYIEDPSMRLEIYRRFSATQSPEQVDVMMAGLKDQYGEPPVEMYVLAELTAVRIAARRLALTMLEFKNGAITATFHNSTPVKPDKIMSMLMKSPEKYQFNPPGTLFIRVQSISGNELVRKTRDELDTIVNLC